MKMYQFDTDIQARRHNGSHHLRVLGYWERTDGDQFFPSVWKFFPEEVWVVRHGHTEQEQTRLLPDLYHTNRDMWQDLADQGEQIYQDMEEVAG